MEFRAANGPRSDRGPEPQVRRLFTVYGASTEEDEPLPCGGAGGASQWMVYLADSTGVLFLNTDGSSFDTILAVYEDTGYGLGELRPLACDDNSGLDGRDSALRVPVVSGHLYYIMVDGVGGATGLTRLNYGLVLPPRLQDLGKTANGAKQIRFLGQAGGRFTIEGTSDWVTWSSLLTTNTATGTYEFVDHASTNLTRRFYRAFGLPW